MAAACWYGPWEAGRTDGSAKLRKLEAAAAATAPVALGTPPRRRMKAISLRIPTTMNTPQIVLGLSRRAWETVCFVRVFAYFFQTNDERHIAIYSLVFTFICGVRRDPCLYRRMGTSRSPVPMYFVVPGIPCADRHGGGCLHCRLLAWSVGRQNRPPAEALRGCLGRGAGGRAAVRSMVARR